MNSLFGVGYTLCDRYVIQAAISQQVDEYIYLIEDGIQNDEICILRQFIPSSQEIAQKLNQFLPEIAQIETVSHPHICQIKDAFWHDKSFCTVEVRVEGKTYHEILTSHTLTESELEQFLVKILDALSYLHRSNIFHRNISPTSVVQRLSDRAPVLTEFGILQDLRECLGLPQSNCLLTELNTVGINDLFSDVSGDLYTLAVTVILLATGKSMNILYNTQTGMWEWEKYKLLSDRLTEVLNRMLAPRSVARYFSADDALQALNPTIVATPINYYPTFAQVPSMPQLSASPELWMPNTSPNTKSDRPQGWMVALGTSILVLLSGTVGFAVFNKGSQVARNEILPTEQPSPLPTATVTITPNPIPTPTVIPVSEEFSAAHAQALTQRYLNAKSNIFAPPFDRQLAAELTTGKLFREIIDASSWMQANNAYYRYAFRSVGATGKIYYGNDSSAIAELRIIEQYKYYQNGREDPSQGDYYDKLVRWSFEKENGVWKISDREFTKKSK